MFYSETLLSKTGPLARVWLSANLERKLSKTHILQSNIETSVGAIVGQDQAPMALRLSGQLLLGVVRIYSRKARYLLEDCNEALMKIKMAFRPGNVDLPTTTNTTHSVAQLTLPDVITELDLLLPDPSSLLADLGDLNLEGTPSNISRRRDIMLDDSSILQDSIETGRNTLSTQEGRNLGIDMNDDLLQLEDDLGLDFDAEPTIDHRKSRDNVRERNLLDDLDDSIEMGRDRPPSRGFTEEFTNENLRLDMDTEMGGVTPKARPRDSLGLENGLGLEEDLGLLDDDNFGLGSVGLDAVSGLDGDSTIPPPANVDGDGLDAAPDWMGGLQELETGPTRESAADKDSPLSSARSSVERELAKETMTLAQPQPEQTDGVAKEPTATAEPDEDALAAAVAAAHRQARKRKVVVDNVTEIRAKQIKAQQEDRSRILKEPSFLPRDPGVLALMTLQRNGQFASSIFYPKNIHPDLANLLSPDFINTMAAAKRKRQEEEAANGIAGSETPAKRVQLELGEDSLLDHGMPPINGDDISGILNAGDTSMIDFPQAQLPGDESTFMAGDLALDNLNRSVSPNNPGQDILPHDDNALLAPLDDAADASVQPVEPAVVSQQTIRAVHLLRNEFSQSAMDSPAKSAQQQRTFTKLLPPVQTTRADATKMFFEVLVLATKDAVKVNQDKGFAGEITIAPKKALWGKWAEEKDEQQVEEEREGELDREREAAMRKGADTQRRVVMVGEGRGREGTAAA